MNSRKIILIIVLLIALAAGLVFIKYFLKSLAIQSQNSMNRNHSVTGSQFQSSEPESLEETQAQNSKAALSPPIGNWQARVVKKPFGIKVSPTNSPV
jgi:flagellar basal body-associated protein FliL